MTTHAKEHFEALLGIAPVEMDVHARGIWARQEWHDEPRAKVNRWRVFIAAREGLSQEGDNNTYPAVWIWNETNPNGYRFEPDDPWSSCAAEIPKKVRPVAERMHREMLVKMLALPTAELTLEDEGWALLAAGGQPQLGATAEIKFTDGRHVAGKLVAFSEKDRRVLLLAT